MRRIEEKDKEKTDDDDMAELVPAHGKELQRVDEGAGDRHVPKAKNNDGHCGNLGREMTLTSEGKRHTTYNTTACEGQKRENGTRILLTWSSVGWRGASEEGEEDIGGAMGTREGVAIAVL